MTSDLFADYRSTRWRTPLQPTLSLTRDWDQSLSFKPAWPNLAEADADLTINGRVNGDPIGERIIVEGRISDENGVAVAGALIEIWQANSAGRYIHREEIHPAPLDPNFQGAGRCVSDSEGNYRFITIKPGAYPWSNHRNAWRPAHIHFSIFGCGIIHRLVTQMYFPSDPLLSYDPIFNSISDARIRNRLIGQFSIAGTIPDWAHCYKFDITLAGSSATPFEESAKHG